jgi:hypothetical protein
MTTTRTPAASRFRKIDPQPDDAPPMPNQTDKTLAQIRTESSSAVGETTRRDQMTTDKIAQNMEVIGADGVHVGTVDGVASGRIRLAKPTAARAGTRATRISSTLDLSSTSRGRGFAFLRRRLWP